MGALKRIFIFLLVIDLVLFTINFRGKTAEFFGKDDTVEDEDRNENNETPNDTPEDQKPAEKPKKELWAEQYDCITIAEALTLCEQFVDAPTTDRYYIIATVKSVDNATYGQLTIEDETGSIMVYGTNSADGSQKYDQMGGDLKPGDVILIYGTLQNYNGSTKEVQNAWLIDHYTPESTTPEINVKPGDTITIAEALAIAGKTGANDRFYITATVASVTNAQYGAMILEDETGEISVYNSKNADGTVDYKDMEDKPYKGDTVTVYATLQNFNGNLEIKSAYITAFTHAEINVSEDDYTEMSVADARAADNGALIKVSGVVASITYDNGYIPSGFYLIDSTNSIYVYDRDVTARVAEGNTITILATKDFWISEKEVSNAEKFGYKGCNQLTDAYLLENDNEKSNFEKSWIEETTVKKILNTPVTENITTTIYKVTALVNKSEGADYVNYYFNDLDGVTGSYTYTKCNGGDFEWLDKFDGKICTVYLSPINAKSSATGCNWRFMPILVLDEGYQFNLADAPEFVFEYYVKDQFKSNYTADPALELVTSISSELLGFENAKIVYTSDNETVAKITTENGVTVLNLLSYGNATVTATVTCGDYSVSKDLDIVYSAPVEYDYISVEDAINTEVGETVIVKGVVGPSLVNKDGFYLVDGTNFIAVTVLSKDILAEIEIGNEIIISGKRDLIVAADKADTRHGQTVISGVTVLANYFGSHTYSSDEFITDMTVEQIYDLDEMVDYTTTGFIVTATVKFNTNTVTLLGTDENKQLRLYAGSNAAYNWLAEYADQEITLEIAACNWNNKTYYTACVLAVVLEDGTRIYNTLNFSN